MTRTTWLSQLLGRRLTTVATALPLALASAVLLAVSASAASGAGCDAVPPHHAGCDVGVRVVASGPVP